MREVDDAERSENERQPERDKRVGAALVEPVQELEEYGVQHAPQPALRAADILTAIRSDRDPESKMAGHPGRAAGHLVTRVYAGT